MLQRYNIFCKHHAKLTVFLQGSLAFFYQTQALHSLSEALLRAGGYHWQGHTARHVSRWGIPPDPIRGQALGSSIYPDPFFIRRGLEPLPKPLANRWQGDVVDSEGKPSPSRFWYGSPAFALNRLTSSTHSGFAMVFDIPAFAAP